MMQLSVNQLRLNAAKRWAEVHSNHRQHWHWDVRPAIAAEGRVVTGKPMVVRCQSGQHFNR